MFIVLNTESGDQILVNAHLINAVVQKTNGSTIFFIRPNDYIQVKESIDEIYNMLTREK